MHWPARKLNTFEPGQVFHQRQVRVGLGRPQNDVPGLVFQAEKCGVVGQPTPMAVFFGYADTALVHV
jgi:hypothetical protein